MYGTRVVLLDLNFADLCPRIRTSVVSMAHSVGPVSAGSILGSRVLLRAKPFDAHDHRWTHQPDP